MRYFLFIFGLTVVVVMLLLGPRGRTFTKPPLYIFPDMERQLKLRPQKDNTFFTFDFGVDRPFHFGERMQLIPRIEVFNAFNWTNYGCLDTFIAPGGNTNFGNPGCVIRLGRREQVGVRVNF